MKLKPGKKCRIYGEMDNVRVVRVNGEMLLSAAKTDNAGRYQQKI